MTTTAVRGPSCTERKERRCCRPAGLSGLFHPEDNTSSTGDEVDVSPLTKSHFLTLPFGSHEAVGGPFYFTLYPQPLPDTRQLGLTIYVTWLLMSIWQLRLFFTHFQFTDVYVMALRNINISIHCVPLRDPPAEAWNKLKTDAVIKMHLYSSLH